MNRRSFLSLFGSAATVVAVKPTYFFAPVGGWKTTPAPLTVGGFYRTDDGLGVATGITLDKIVFINGLSRIPPMYNDHGIIVQNLESDHDLRTRLQRELAQRRSAAAAFESMYVNRAEAVIDDPPTKRFGRNIA